MDIIDARCAVIAVDNTESGHVLLAVDNDVTPLTPEDARKLALALVKHAEVVESKI